MKKLRVVAAALTLAIAINAPATSAQSSQLSAEAQQIIQHFNMQHIPHEGPWFVQSAKSNEVVEGAIARRYDSPRYAYTAILSLLTVEDFSALHRLNTDEIWHYYGGAPAEILLLYPDGHDEIRVLGNDIAAGQVPQILVPRGVWMGARVID
ncbi:cupin domain-containing protein, partial [Alteromonas sp. 14N.309.X.WAT.G.H12]|uniref:cupin domain-containing protein n=1 Tax=Alteromonas sp. 14N.309.X.WAT.G.H12 TaxID=3120824 RepID=UPI002FD40E04